MSDDSYRDEVLNPGTSPARLAEIAAVRPDLHPKIVKHPASYPDLVAWIEAAGVASESAVPAAAPRTTTGRTPLLVAAGAFGLALVLGVVGSLIIPAQVKAPAAPPAIEAGANGAAPEEGLAVGQILDPGPALALAEIADTDGAVVEVDPAAGVDPGGYRGLRLGMSYAQAALVEPTLTVRRIDAQIVEVDCAWAALVFDSGSLVSILPKAETVNIDGLGPGDSVSLAATYYGEAIETGSDAAGDFVVYQAPGAASSGYRLYVDGDFIDSIVVCVCGRATPLTGDYSTWEISAEGVGPLRFGQSIESLPTLVPAAAGMNYAWLDGVGVPRRLAPTGAGSAVLLGTPPLTIHEIYAYDYDEEVPVERSDRLAGVYLSDTTPDGGRVPGVALPRFANGVGIGSTAAAVLEAFPGGSTINGYYAFGYRYMTATGVAFDFYAETGSGSTALISSISITDYTVD